MNHFPDVGAAISNLEQTQNLDMNFGRGERVMKGSPSRQEGRNLSVLVAYGVIGVLAAVWSIIVFRLPILAYIRDLNVDDSFYYYVIARNFAAGNFSTFDGLNLTNGYHPLWAWLLTPVFALVADPVLALRFAKLMELALLLVAAYFAMSAARAAGWHLLAVSIIPLWLFSKKVFFIGMEAAPQVLMLALLLFMLTRLFKNPKNKSAWLGIVGLCVAFPWVRLECVSVSIMTAATLTLYVLWRNKALIGGVIAVWLSSLGGAALYFVTNHIIFGTSLPVSGQVKNYWSSIRFAQSGDQGNWGELSSLQHYQDNHYDFFDNAIIFINDSKLLSLVVLLACVILVISWLVPRYRKREFEASHAIDAFVLILISAHVARVIYSILFIHILYNAAWYYVPGFFLMVLLPPLAVSRFLLLAGLAIPSMARRQWLERGVAGLCLIMVAYLANPLADMAAWGQEQAQRDWEIASLEGVEWMNDHLPAGSVIGSPDSGVVGYFSKHHVINLDGLVNSEEFFSAVKAQAVEAWMMKAGITHLAGGMSKDVMDGCAYFAKASAQAAAYQGPCTLLYQGMPFEVTFGDTTTMTFRVFTFGASGPQPNP